LVVELQSIEYIGLLRMAGTIFCCAASIVANLEGWFCQVREVLEMTMVNDVDEEVFPRVCGVELGVGPGKVVGTKELRLSAWCGNRNLEGHSSTEREKISV
jgi:hypothetical protein